MGKRIIKETTITPEHDTDGNLLWLLDYEGNIISACYPEITTRDADFYELGIKAARAFIWDKLADLIEDDTILGSIKWEDLFRKKIIVRAEERRP